MKIKIPDTLRITNPRWVKKLESRKTWEEISNECEVDGRTLNISNYQCCIVGEALDLFDIKWGEFRKNYNQDIQGDLDADTAYHRRCRLCGEWSMTLFNEVESLAHASSDVEELEDDLQKFATHLEQDHPEYIEEAKIRNAQ